MAVLLLWVLLLAALRRSSGYAGKETSAGIVERQGRKDPGAAVTASLPSGMSGLEVAPYGVRQIAGF